MPPLRRRALLVLAVACALTCVARAEPLTSAPVGLRGTPAERLSAGVYAALVAEGMFGPPPVPRARAGPADLSKGKPLAVLDPRVGPNIRLGDDPPDLPPLQRGQAEPHIVRSAVNPDLLLATFQEGRHTTNGGAITCGYAVSRDGGFTWTRALIPQLTLVNGGPYLRATDPVAAAGPQGELYLNALGSIDNGFGRAAVVVSRSTDSGATWSAPSVVFQSSDGNIAPDKNWIGVNDFAGTTTAGRLAVAWTNFRSTNGNFTGTDLSLSISDNRGTTWSAPVAITPVGANDQGALPMFLPDGSLVVIYSTFFGNNPQFGIRCKRSVDGGRTLPANPTTVVNLIDEWHDPQLRHGPFLPSATVARSTGMIFVTYVAVIAPGQARVFVTRSANQGTTWSTPVAVSDQPPGVSVLNPAIAVSADGRSVAVEFMDKRNAPDGANFVDHYAALSFDGGTTWQPNIRLTEMSSDIRFAAQTPSGYMLGDYLAVAPPVGSAQPFVGVWCDTRTGDADPVATRLVPQSDATYEAWKVARFSPAQLADPNTSGELADPDGDALINRFEYRFGTNPLVAESGELAVVTRGAAQPTISWQQRTTEPEVAGIGTNFFGGATESLFGVQLPGNAAPAVAPRSGMQWINFELNRRGGPGRITFGMEDAAVATTSRLTNLSTRGRSGSGASQMIVGFVIDGNKSVLVRAAGPALSGLGVAGALADPRLTLSAPASDLLRTNDNWQQGEATSAVFARLGAFPFPANSLDAALLLSLGPENYSAIVSGANTAGGVTLVEAYDADPNPGAPSGPRFLNLSTRGEAGAGENALIAGFVINGTQPRRVLIRAVGPSLAAVGVANPLADPVLTLFRGAAVLATNDDWEISRSGAAIAATAQNVGAFALNPASLDAALLITLAPGNYTVVVSSADGGTGIALVEIYDAD